MSDIRLPFGLYSDRPLSEIPDSYLKFLLDRGWFRLKFPTHREAILLELVERIGIGTVVYTEREKREMADRLKPYHERAGFAARAKARWGDE